MFYRFCLVLCGFCLLLLLSACGSSSNANSSTANNSPGTHSQGPVVISTDHSVYQSTDHIQVTVLNTLNTPIYAMDTQASCSILSLEIQVNSQWRPSSAARCSLGRPAVLVKVEAGKTYATTVQADFQGTTQAALPAGTYRLMLNYSLSNNPSSVLSNPTIVYSMAFSITASGSTANPTIPPTSVTPPTP